MAIQRTTLNGDDSPRTYPDGSARPSEIDERIEDMIGRGWSLEFKSAPLVTEKKLFNHNPGSKFGSKHKFIGSESRAKVKAVMIRDYTPTIGGRRNEKKRSRSAI